MNIKLNNITVSDHNINFGIDISFALVLILIQILKLVLMLTSVYCWFCTCGRNVPNLMFRGQLE